MAVVVVALAIVLYALASSRLSQTWASGALIFTVVGVVIGPEGLGILQGEDDRFTLETLLEVALGLILFTDAVSVASGDWRRKGRVPARLLLIGMPLTIALGWLATGLLPGDNDLWTLALVAISLAPTDAALGQAVVTDPRVPAIVREGLNVESGLNDGLALPFLILALAAAKETGGAADGGVAEVFVRSLVFAAVVGIGTGTVGGVAIRWARQRGWCGVEWARIATLALVVIAYVLADHLGGSGFIATWTAGAAFGRVIGDRGASELAEDLGAVLAPVAFMGFGAVLLGPILDDLTWRSVAYGVLSLTLIRLLPVAVSLIGTGFSRPTVAYAGWFGPRGLASIVFALLIADEQIPGSEAVVETILVTVALSVILHGVTAQPGVARYAAWFRRARAIDPELPEGVEVSQPLVRRTIGSG